ncbi:MAG TPA: hypothetical protein VHU40_13525, partial [Polyangia bacterium]|nr:hypothetical protein [Polyangia bacterium]
MLRSSFGALGLLLTMLTVATAGAGCKRGGPGACREDVDCPAGFDCAERVCVPRQRLRFGIDARPATPAPASPAASDGGPPPPP